MFFKSLDFENTYAIAKAKATRMQGIYKQEYIQFDELRLKNIYDICKNDINSVIKWLIHFKFLQYMFYKQNPRGNE